MSIKQLKIGSKLTNQELSSLFGCSTQGGMRRSHKTSTLVLISNNVESIYKDRWKNGILHYVGMGQIGDQILKGNQNKTLAESDTNGVSVHLFEVFTDKEYTYAGRVKLCGKYYQEEQFDKNGHKRKVYVFPIKVVSDNV